MALDELPVDSSPPGEISSTGYRAKVDFVSPQNRRDTFELEYECFLGVSLGNRNFEPVRFHSLLEWVSRRFSKCKILVGDSIHRLTLESCSGMSAHEAHDRALISRSRGLNSSLAMKSSRRPNILHIIAQSRIISTALLHSANRSRVLGFAIIGTTGICSA